MRFRTDLLIEGVATVDGRLVEVGATDWSLPQRARYQEWPIRFESWVGVDAAHPEPVLVGWIHHIAREALDVDTRIVATGMLAGAPRIDRVRAMAADGTLRLAADISLDRHGADLVVINRPPPLHGRHVVMIDEPTMTFVHARVLGASIIDPVRPAWSDLRFELLAP